MIGMEPGAALKIADSSAASIPHRTINAELWR
jgi:hypothetical protein